MPYCGNIKDSPNGHCAQSRFIKRTVDDNVRGLDPKNNGQGQPRLNYPLRQLPHCWLIWIHRLGDCKPFWIHIGELNWKHFEQKHQFYLQNCRVWKDFGSISICPQKWHLHEYPNRSASTACVEDLRPLFFVFSQKFSNHVTKDTFCQIALKLVKREVQLLSL